MQQVTVWSSVLWDVAPCSLIGVTDVSEVRAASIIRAMDALRGTTPYKTLNFILAPATT
jgi:hypothetical protein